MIPYIEHPSLTIGSYTFYAFGILICVAILVGYEIVVRRGPAMGLQLAGLPLLYLWTIMGVLTGSHLFDVVAYTPELLATDPWELFNLRGSMSSAGGLIGGLASALGVTALRGWRWADRLRYIDCLAFAFPFASVFGRAGCALAHDHLGIASSHWLAVRFPAGPRFDLGLLEMLFLLGLSAVFAWLARRPRPNGFYAGLFCATYVPARFALDTLRLGEARYGGWTPAQYVALAVAAAGLAALVMAFRRKRPLRPPARLD